MENAYLDYKIFVVREISQTACTISGENKKNILIGILSENNAELDVFLEKVINAAKLSLKTDCLMINVAEKGDFPLFSQISSQHALQSPIEKAIFFGLKPKNIGLNIDTPQYLPLLFNDCTFLFVDSLSKIASSNELKKALWNCLQQMFL